ncbi:MAG: hypothetical protein WBK67_03900 [Minisyncoccales bacterium]|jgi:hypothetical protein
MKHLLGLVGLLAVFFSIVGLLKPQKVKRLIYNISYFLSFWVWGLLSLIFSVMIWHQKGDSFLYIILFGFFFLLGAIFLFSPKRKIKKKLENFVLFEERKLRVLFTTSLVITFVMTVIIIIFL